MHINETAAYERIVCGCDLQENSGCPFFLQMHTENALWSLKGKKLNKLVAFCLFILRTHLSLTTLSLSLCPPYLSIVLILSFSSSHSPPPLFSFLSPCFSTLCLLLKRLYKKTWWGLQWLTQLRKG